MEKMDKCKILKITIPLFVFLFILSVIFLYFKNLPSSLILLAVSFIALFFSFYLVGEKMKREYIQILSIVSILSIVLCTLSLIRISLIEGDGGMFDFSGFAKIILFMLVLFVYVIAQVTFCFVILFGAGETINSFRYSAIFLIGSIIPLIIILIFKEKTIFSSFFVIFSLILFATSFVCLIIGFYKFYIKFCFKTH